MTAAKSPDGGADAGRGETLVLRGSVDGRAVGTLTFTVWTRRSRPCRRGATRQFAVLLLWRGAMRFRRPGVRVA